MHFLLMIDLRTLSLPKSIRGLVFWRPNFEIDLGTWFLMFLWVDSDLLIVVMLVWDLVGTLWDKVLLYWSFSMVFLFSWPFWLSWLYLCFFILVINRHMLYDLKMFLLFYLYILYIILSLNNDLLEWIICNWL